MIREITAYQRNKDGTLTQIRLLADATGVVDGWGLPLHPTNHIEVLQGWSFSHARVWLTDGGVEVLVPAQL